jgi:hypothetical protein
MRRLDSLRYIEYFETERMNHRLVELASSVSSRVEKRLFAEYGAVFATTATPPPAIIFENSSQVDAFQSTLTLKTGVFGDYEIQLQEEALNALWAAAAESARIGFNVTARAADSGGRSYDDTVRLWLRNVSHGLEHWESESKIAQERAKSIRNLSPVEQVGVILDLEENQKLFFGTFFDRSILYSVAAPGASQHLSMLAFDVAEYDNPDVKAVLGKYGWHRTVPNDLPHFTYLGHEEEVLPILGLQYMEQQYGDRVYGFWTPDLDRLLYVFGNP